jgi:polysaccharide biosynthesis protein PslH
MTKKKLLFLSPQLPFPPVSGGVIKSWRLTEYLNEHYELSLATFLKNDDSIHVEEFLTKVPVKKYYFEAIDVPRTPLNLVKSNLMFIPLNLFRNRSEKFRKNIVSLVAEADYIFVDHYEMFQYVPDGLQRKSYSAPTQLRILAVGTLRYIGREFFQETGTVQPSLLDQKV